MNVMTSTAVEPAVGDAFGQLLLRAYEVGGEPGHVFEVTERDDGYISVRDAAGYFAPIAPYSCEADVLDRATGRVLDVGCGAGRHLGHLTQRGMTAVGLDISPGAVEVCTRRGLDAVHGSILTPPDLGTFDTFLMFGANLGLLGDPATAQQLLTVLHRLSRPGARILAEGLDPASADPAHVAYHERNRAAGMPAGQVRLRIRDRDLATDWISLWWLAPSELRSLLHGTGWQAACIWRPATGPVYYTEIVRTQTQPWPLPPPAPPR